MKYDKMSATISGTTVDGEAFTETVEFTLFPPKDGTAYYGTGYTMQAKKPNYTDTVDVRYEKTTDIEILADRWIKNVYGNNTKDVIKQFPTVRNNERTNNTMDTRDTYLLIAEIAKKADDMKLLDYDRMTMMMDLECAVNHFGLDLNSLREAEQADFAHDIIGIQSNINRETKSFDKGFWPRFTAQEDIGKPGEDKARCEYIATRKTFYPEAGKTYENEGGGTYICLDTVYNSRNGEVHAIMENTKTGWILNAHGIGVYEDGKIDWDYSTGGHFKENSSDVLDLTDEQSIGRK